MKKEKKEKIRRKGALEQGSDVGTSDTIAIATIRKGEERSDHDLYDIFREGARRPRRDLAGFPAPGC